MRARSSLFNNRLTRFVHRARLGKDRQALLDTWQAQVSQGEALERLKASPDWPAFLELLTGLQRDADAMTKRLDCSPDHRLIAVAQWCAFQAVTRELTAARRRGQQATAALAKVHVTPVAAPTT